MKYYVETSTSRVFLFGKHIFLIALSKNVVCGVVLYSPKQIGNLIENDIFKLGFFFAYSFRLCYNVVETIM